MTSIFRPLEGITQVGFVIQEEKKAFLKHNLIWYRHKDIKNAYVHPQYVLHYLILTAQNWEIKPKWVYIVMGPIGKRVFNPEPIEFTFDYTELNQKISFALGL